MSISFCEAMQERTEKEHFTPCSLVRITPRLREVCTRPGKSALISCTPCGRARSTCSSLDVSAAENAAGTSAFSHTREMPPSVTAYSFLSVASNSLINASNAGASDAESATSASFLRQMTLSNCPPVRSLTRSDGQRSIALYSVRPIRQLALPRP